jgi:hypothetical protein
MGKQSISPAARWLSRSQVAVLLGATDRQVAKMDGRQLHPTRAPDRVWRYDPAEVRALLSGPGAASERGAPRALVDGEVTAEVFALFEAGKPLPQVAIATKQTAATIMQLRAEYDAMVGGLLLRADTVADLRTLAGADARTPRDLVAAIRRALDARFEEGRADAQDFGEVLDPATGQLRRVEPKKPEPKAE